MTHRHRPRRSPALTLTGALAVAAALTALTGCQSGSEKTAAASGPLVVAPGKPGEAAKTLSPQAAKKARGGDTKPNAADLRYVRMMITHHRQALTMTELADKHAEKPRVRKLSERISAAQGPEIAMMQGWLKQHGKSEKSDGTEHGGHQGHDGHDAHDEPSGHGEHGAHGGTADMPGMASPQELDRLRAARGGDFDRLFLKLMTAHHKGAVTMATDLLSGGNDVRVNEMATDVIAQQNAEIDRMDKLL